MKEFFKTRIASLSLSLTLRLTGIVLAALIAVSFTACDDGNDVNGNGKGNNTSFTSITELINYLDGTSPNTAAAPLTVKVNMNLRTDWIDIVNALNSGVNRYVALDLSGSIGTSINGYLVEYYDGFDSSSSVWVTSVILPNTIDRIGELSFVFFTNLASITIPNSVTSIGVYAFYGCTSLASITIPNSVTSIEGYAFEDCTSLTSITIPNSVTSIGICSFYGCTSLTSITIPNSVTSIEGYAFEDCTSLTSVTFQGTINADNFGFYEYYDDDDGYDAGYGDPFPGDLREKYLAGGIGTYTRPNGSDTWTKQ